MRCFHGEWMETICTLNGASACESTCLCKARFPLGEFVRATRSENKNPATWLVKIGWRKNSPRTSRKRSYFFVCSREQIRLVENRLNVNSTSMARSNHYAPLHMRAKKESWKNITLFLYSCEILETWNKWTWLCYQTKNKNIKIYDNSTPLTFIMFNYSWIINGVVLVLHKPDISCVNIRALLYLI